MVVVGIFAKARVERVFPLRLEGQKEQYRCGWEEKYDEAERVGAAGFVCEIAH